jgi:hypothetical protein
MADIGPNQYQGGIAGGKAPEVNRYEQQVEVTGTPQPAGAQGHEVISGFGRAAPDLARGINAVGAARTLWLEQQKSAAELHGRQSLAHAAGTIQPGQSISQAADKGLKRFIDAQIKSANTPELKMALSSELAHVTNQVRAAGQALDQRQVQDDALKYFDQTLTNKEQIYATLAYDHIDAHLADDLGGINSQLKLLPIESTQRTLMQQEMLVRLTNAANTVKLQQDPERYLQTDALDQPIQSGISGLSYAMGTNDQRARWRADAQRSIDARYAAAAQAAQRQAVDALQLRRDTTNNLIDKFSTGALIPADILNSGLAPDVQQQAIAMMARGPVASGNSSLHRQLFIQAANGNLGDRSDLLPHLARQDGINPQQAQNIAFADEMAKEPYFRRFAATAELTTTDRRHGNDTDPEGDQQSSNMLMDLQGQIIDGGKLGLSPRDLLDPDSKHYIGDRLIAAYTLSPFEKLSAEVEKERQVRISLGDRTARLQGESFADYMKRKLSDPA